MGSIAPDISAASGCGANATNDGGSTEKYETSEDDNCTMPPVYAAGKHREAHCGHGYDGNDRRCCPEQGALQPGECVNDHARPFGISGYPRRNRARDYSRDQRNERVPKDSVQGHYPPMESSTSQENATKRRLEPSVFQN